MGHSSFVSTLGFKQIRDVFCSLSRQLILTAFSDYGVVGNLSVCAQFSRHTVLHLRFTDRVSDCLDDEVPCCFQEL